LLPRSTLGHALAVGPVLIVAPCTVACARPEWRKTIEKKAERILSEELNGRGWEAQQLCGTRKADSEKLKIAQRLRTETRASLRYDHVSCFNAFNIRYSSQVSLVSPGIAIEGISNFIFQSN
jgi:hypothetical protein